MSESYAGQQIVGVDLHRRRSVIVRMTEAGEHLETVRILNDRERLAAVMTQAGESPEVVLEATYGWYWAADALAELGAKVHLAHPLGVKMFSYRRVKNDQRDAADLADLLGDGPAARGLDRPARDEGAAALGAAPGQAGRAALEPEVSGPRGARWRRRHGGDERPVRGGGPPAAGQDRLVHRGTGPGGLGAAADHRAGLRGRAVRQSWSPAGYAPTSATRPFRPSPGSGRCSRRCSSPRSATSVGFPARRSWPAGPGSPRNTASPTPPATVAGSPNRARGWSAGPRSRPCNECPRTPVSGRSATGSVSAGAATSVSWPRPAS